ncbi:MAG: DNA-directed RNA polymerase subunit beta' [Caldilineaceae bacterium]|nr:DNA-directed RNA polymerase subunit beta' [Caldilineaceae bacterium]MCB9120832.1 DNA-directed RNA polymerase subunit beta' [Caldilineaceae bacterium]MCB9123909.1 DNA-directed RNA polymerase subunit beta' [Caldilineaceae bacterium]
MEVKNFDAIRISLASPERIREWSYGEVTKPETINYRTLRPERDGLFCERIFGPTRDWECACGKYKRVRYKGIVCDKCGVEVAPSRVRRERMGHIELASPVSHIWYVKGVPSRLGLLLNISPRHLERVLYFAQYIVTNVNEDARSRAIQRHERELQSRMQRVEGDVKEQLERLEGDQDAQLSALDQEEESAIQKLNERINEESSQIIAEAQKFQTWIHTSVGKKATEDKLLSWSDQAVLRTGEIVSMDYDMIVNDLVQEKLNELQTLSDEEKSDIRLRISAKRDYVRQELGAQIDSIRSDIDNKQEMLRTQMDRSLDDLKSLEEKQLLTENRYRELSERWGNVFTAGMGAEAVRDIVAKLDLEKMQKELRREMRTTKSKQRRKKAAKRLRVVENFRKSGNRPEWMILTALPVIPPELRPMVQLDGGRFATSDLNDLYRRVINRNNRLKRLMELGAPDVIVRNEKRMLQEAVDSLIDNGRRGRAVSRSGKRKLKSLSDLLKGKQGRFRRNLLGKRVDYSGRSVIVIGPTLKLHQCGLPKKMALELFKPFVMRRLVENNFAHNIKSAKRMVDRMSPEVWDVLEEICHERPVLLNRAPTLHRLGIQAFEVVLIEGSAIQLHPLTCAAFNADFDGDQMAVHVPLSDEAVKEARELMLATQNLLKPSSGDPIVGPSKDMVMGVYYLTVDENEEAETGKLPAFASMEEAEYAYDMGIIKLRQPIRILFKSKFDEMSVDDLEVSDRVLDALKAFGIVTVGQLMDHYTHGERKMIGDIPAYGAAAMDETREALRRHGLLGAAWPKERLMRTTVGRIIFNRALPEELWFVNELLDRKGVDAVVARCYKHLGRIVTSETVDNIKDLGFRYATRSGITIAISDINVPEKKAEILEHTTAEVEKAEQQYRRGLITEEELYNKTVELWTRATDDVTDAVKDLLSPIEGLGAMARSGATKGGINPVRQLAGMRGLMADPNGRIIPLPIRSNFREGLTALEYFLSTHGARKGLADTALRTADAGYLTRRLVDVAQDVIITEDDCLTMTGIWITEQEAKTMGETFAERVAGRFLAADVSDPETGEVLLKRNELLTEAALATLARHHVEKAYVRNPLTCEARFGMCAHCYGEDLARGGLIKTGEAVGIVAAQSIGEPGTQLTLRTFHTGGVAGADDITQGLPRVEELFEARTPKGEAIIAEIDGKVSIAREGEIRILRISRTDLKRREVRVPAEYELVAADGDRVQEDVVIARKGDETILAGMDGEVFIERHGNHHVATIRREETEVWEVELPANARLRIEDGQDVQAGEQLTEGAKNPKEILRISGREATQLYLLSEVQRVYRSQGVNIHDKHIEVILRQLLRRVMVRTAGDTDLLPGELLDRFKFEDINDYAVSRGGKPARAEPIVLGLTKAALNTESFLAMASFQETTRVLTEAAIRGQRDELRGLKENVIIGKLIPVGTGFSQRRVAVTNLEDEVELLIDAEIDQDEDLGDVDDSDLSMEDFDLDELDGVAELGMEPLGAGVTLADSDEDAVDLDFNSLDEEEEEDNDSFEDLDVEIE